MAESDDPPSEDDQVTIIGLSSGIADRVRHKNGTSAKALKATPKRKLMLPTPPTISTRQKGQLTAQKVVALLNENEDIHGEYMCYYFSDSAFMHLLIDCILHRSSQYQRASRCFGLPSSC